MRKNIFVMAFFTIVAAVFTWPLILNFNRFITDPVDGLLITWILNWSPRAAGLNANIFFPYANTFAFSEMMLPLAALAWPVVRLTGEPLAAYNFIQLSGLALTGWSMYLLAFHLTKKFLPAIFIAVLFDFSAIHLGYLPHVQLLNFWPVILATLFLVQKRYRLFVLMFVIASLTTVLFFYFLILITIIFRDKKSLVYLVAACLLTAPFFVPYYLVSRQFHYQRPITDAIHFSLAPSDLLGQFFPGWAFLILLIVAIRKIRGVWLIIAVASFILAFGPALHIFKSTVHIGPIPAIPLPYALLYYLLPGFAGLRTPSRWILLTSFALTMAIVVWLAKQKFKYVVYVVLVVLVVLEIEWPLKFTRVPAVREFPPEQIWLRDNFKGTPIIQFPIYGWWDEPGVETETLREYYSTVHWHPMYNGYSGFSPREWEEKVKWLQKEFPSPETVSYLRAIGVKLILVPKDLPLDLKKISEFEKTAIYEI